MKIRQTLILSVVVLTGCSSAGNPGTTLWAGLTNYREEMRTLEAKPERWPERQRLAESIKTTYVVTVGASREFNRLVDIDVRRREILVVLCVGSLIAECATNILNE